MNEHKGRPGSALASLIPDWAVADEAQKGCSCKKWVRKMDKYGVQWCKTNEGAIVAHLLGSRD